MYTYTVSDGRFKVFMGDDKFENEFLISYGWPEDVWFHVDDYSSAHVYVRCCEGYNYQNLPEDLVQECCSIVKANSIEGSSKASVNVIYTPWSNLRKDQSMDTGTIGFVKNNMVIKVRNVNRNRELEKQLERSRVHVIKKEHTYRDEREQRDKQEILAQKKRVKEEAAMEKKNDEIRQKERELRHFESIHAGDGIGPDVESLKGDGTMKSCKELEEDFM